MYQLVQGVFYKYFVDLFQVDSAKEKEGGEKETTSETAEIKKETESGETTESSGDAAADAAAKKSEEEAKSDTPKDRVIKDGQLQVSVT